MNWDNVKRDLDHSMLGKIRKKGQEYARAKGAKNPGSSADTPKKGRKPMSNFVKKSAPYSIRSLIAIKNQAKKFDSLDVLWTRRIPEDWVLDEEELNQSSDSESGEDSEEGGVEDSESDSGLEEDSDDEQDGMKPAGNANEGTPVCAV